MVIFGPDLIGKILAGQKTVTRRRLHGSDTGIGWRGPSRYQAGKVYAVQPGRGKHHVGHIVVISVHEEKLCQIMPQSAADEGFPVTGIGGFMRCWMRLHGAWNPEEVVAVIKFRLAHKCPHCWSLPGSPPTDGKRQDREEAQA